MTTTKISPTKAMMAARALDKLAAENIAAAKGLEDEFPGAASNALELASWYSEVAHALKLLDRLGCGIESEIPRVEEVETCA